MTLTKDFDYGTEETIEGGGFKQPVEGPHSAVVRSIIHCGMYKASYHGKPKPPAPFVVAVFELKGKLDFEDDGVTPLTTTKLFPLKKGAKAFLTLFRKALGEDIASMKDFIGKKCTVTLEGGDAKNEDGTPKYVNFKSMSALSPEFLEIVGDLAIEGVGHVAFDEITEEALMELNPILHVNGCIMEGEKYTGSVVETVINKIRETDPEYAVKNKKETEEKKEVEVENNLSEERTY